MQKLHLPEYHFRWKKGSGKTFIFDEFRKKWVVLSPEEWVRQNFLKFFTTERGFPGTLMTVEKKVLVNGLIQRFDLLVHDRKGNPLLVAEFKSPGTVLNQLTIEQVLRYNSVLKAPFFLISNGISHFVCRVDFKDYKTEYLAEIPRYEELIPMDES